MTKFVYLCYMISFYLFKRRIPLLPFLINKIFVRIIGGCQIGMGAQLGRNVILGYGGLGVVIHHNSILGDNVNVGSGVTIGGTTGKNGVPVIGKNTILSSGCKVIGPISIGDNCVIGANAVVLSDIPPNSVVVGIPAKIIKENIDINDYLKNKINSVNKSI